MQQANSFRNRTGVIATMHKKEQVIAPLVEKELEINVVVPPDLNTDVFGTFTREVKRTGTQIEAARLKAEKALELTGETLAFASEGSFGPHPLIPYLSANREIVILLDKVNEIEIIGQSISTDTNHSHQQVSNLKEAFQFAEKAGFPEHALVAIVGDAVEGKGEIIKGIATKQSLIDAVESSLKKSPNGKVHLETDMRAMYNPTRMKNIEKATLDLIKKIQQPCPKCGCPGFDVTDRKKGLPCELCYLPTHLTLAVTYQCKKCSYAEEKLFPDGRETADPSQCQYCNP
ncbi:MAG TPA: DUF6671 family protein [Leptolyngbyaceae cyanobacterium]